VAQVSRPNDAKLPPSWVADGQDHNLPAPPRRMVGRDQTVDEISDKLTNKRFVHHLWARAASARPRSPFQTGYALLKPFVGQVRFFDLGAIRDAALVPNVIVSALGCAGLAPTIPRTAWWHSARQANAADTGLLTST